MSSVSDYWHIVYTRITLPVDAICIKVLGIVLLVLLSEDCGMLCRDLSETVNLLASLKKATRLICLNLPLTKVNMFLYNFVM